MPRRGPTARALSAEDDQQLAEIRQSALAELRNFAAQASPADPLGAIAWLVGALGPVPAEPWTTELVARIDLARSNQITWREIAQAMGEGSDGDAARRVRDRFTVWSKSTVDR